MKIIYLKDESTVTVSQYEELRFKDNWVHIHGGYQDRYELKQSIPINKINARKK